MHGPRDRVLPSQGSCSGAVEKERRQVQATLQTRGGGGGTAPAHVRVQPSRQLRVSASWGGRSHLPTHQRGRGGSPEMPGTGGGRVRPVDPVCSLAKEV